MEACVCLKKTQAPQPGLLRLQLRYTHQHLAFLHTLHVVVAC
jgi:hypothetical protein